MDQTRKVSVRGSSAVVNAAASVSVLTMLALPAIVGAADATWTGTADGTWNNTSNWTPAGLPNNSVAFFSNNINTSISLANSVPLFGMQFSLGAGNYSFSGARFIAGGTSQAVVLNSNLSASPTITFNNDFQVTPNARGASYDWNFTNNNSTSNLIFNGNVYGDITPAGYSGRLGINGSSAVTINGVISDVVTGSPKLGNVLLRKTGVGTLTLGTQANTYSGGTEMAASTGSIILGNKQSLGTGALRLVGGSSVLQASTDLSGANALANTINYVSTTGTNTAAISATFTAGSDTATWTAGPAPAVGSMVTSVAAQLPYYAKVVSVTGSAGAGTIKFDAPAGVAGSVTNLTTAVFAGGGTGTLNIGGTNPIELSGTQNLTTTSSTLAAATQTFNITNTADTTFSGVLQEQAGSASIIKSGAGRLIISGANLYTGSTTINAGTLRVSGGAAIPDTSAVTLANIAGATLDLNGSNETVASVAGGGALGGGITLGAGTLTISGAANTTYAGTISGSGGLSRSGSGFTTLSASNTYNGLTSVVSGRVTVANNAALGDTAGATASTLGTAYTQVSGTGTVALGGSQTINEAFQIGGTGTASSGALRILNPGTTLNSLVQLTADASIRFVFSGNHVIAGNVDLGTSRTLTLADAGDPSISVSGVISSAAGGNLVLGPNGTYNILNAANSYSGTTTVNAVLGVGSNTALGTSQLLLNAGGIQSTDSTARTLGNALGPVGAGTVTFGQAAVQTGTLSFTNATTASLGSTAHTFVTNVDTTFANGFSGTTATLTKTGAATLFANGVNTYTGLTTISAGTLAGSGSFAGPVSIGAAGTLAPGNSPGVIDFNGALSLAGEANLEINGLARGTGYDGVDTGGLLTYGGDLDIVFGTLVSPLATFDLFQIESGSAGDFNAVTISGLYNATLINVAGVWQGADLAANLQFAFSQGTGDLVVSQVPEPTTAIALGLLGAGFLARRRRA